MPVAWLAIGVSAAVIATRSFRRYAFWLGHNAGAVALVPLADAEALCRARLIAAAVGIASRNAPFRSNCLPQAMAAIYLCRRAGVPYAMHLGVMPSDAPGLGVLQAHAWIECGNVTITGGPRSLARYRALACFTSFGVAGQRDRPR